MSEAARDEPPRRSWVEQIMGLPISVLARGEAARSPAADAAARAVLDELRDVDAVFSLYRPDSALSRLARGEVALAGCPAEVGEVARRCVEAHVLTGGLFDAARPDGTWDPSGLVKGWATQRAARLLGAVADLDWCLNAGGDVAVLAPSGAPFVVGIQDPRDGSRLVATVACTGGGVATSGTAARGAHLWDPRTGAAPTTRWASVTVVGPSLETADVLATAAFVAGDGWRELLARVPGHEGLAVTSAGALVATSGWPGSRATPRIS